MTVQQPHVPSAARVALDRRGRNAGFVSRLAAFIVDLLIMLAVYYLAYLGFALIWGPVNLERPSLPGLDDFVFAVTFGIWMGVYWYVSWAATGKSLGKALFGLRIVPNKADKLGYVRPLIRIVFYPISFIFFCLGYIWIIINRHHRGWHDIAAGTRVIYDWDARPGAMWLARQHANPDRPPGESSDPSSARL